MRLDRELELLQKASHTGQRKWSHLRFGGVMCGALHLMVFVPIISLISLTCEVGVATTFYRT